MCARAENTQYMLPCSDYSVFIKMAVMHNDQFTFCVETSQLLFYIRILSLTVVLVYIVVWLLVPWNLVQWVCL